MTLVRPAAAWLRRAATCLAVLGILVQAGLALPMGLRMAQAGGLAGPDGGVQICSTGHGPLAPDQPAPAHHHADCLLCHLSAGPALLPHAPVMPVPTAVARAASPSTPSRPGPLDFPAGYSSRAPPALA